MVFSITTLSNSWPFVNRITKFRWRYCHVLVDNRPISLYYLNRRVILNFTTYLAITQPTQERKV